MIRYLTAGESHGEALIGIVEGVPAGLPITAEDINKVARKYLKMHRSVTGYLLPEKPKG